MWLSKWLWEAWLPLGRYGYLIAAEAQFPERPRLGERGLALRFGGEAQCVAGTFAYSHAGEFPRENLRLVRAWPQLL